MSERSFTSFRQFADLCSGQRADEIEDLSERAVRLLCAYAQEIKHMKDVQFRSSVSAAYVYNLTPVHIDLSDEVKELKDIGPLNPKHFNFRKFFEMFNRYFKECSLIEERIRKLRL